MEAMRQAGIWNERTKISKNLGTMLQDISLTEYGCWPSCTSKTTESNGKKVLFAIIKRT